MKIRMRPSGALIDLIAPDPALIQLDDLLWHAAHLNRFTGGLGAYNVLEHSCAVAALVADRGGSALDVLCGLAHDLHEALCGDASTPLKHAMRAVAISRDGRSDYDVIEHRCAVAVRAVLGLPEAVPEIVETADHDLGWIEAHWAGMTERWPRPARLTDQEIDDFSPAPFEPKQAITCWRLCWEAVRRGGPQ